MDAKAHARKLVQTAHKNMKRKSRAGVVTVTVEDIAQRIERGYCEATGVAFELSNPYQRGSRKKTPSNPLAPSLDRIDSEDENYSPENTQVVTSFWNNAKGSQLSNEETYQMMFTHLRGLQGKKP